MVPNLIRTNGQYINNKPNLLKSIVKFSKHNFYAFPFKAISILHRMGMPVNEVW